MDTEQIREQQAAGFPDLRFAPGLEEPYCEARAARLRQRAQPVSIAGLVLFLIYAGMDLLTLPPELARATVTIRLAITCPMIALVVWLAHRPWPSDRVFEQIYLLAYLCGGLSVVAIIGVARAMAFPLPYEGMILMLMFGYFAMGLPFLSASLASLALVVSYLLVELWSGEAALGLISNLFFLMTANVIGMIGAWSSEYRHRAHFLDRQLLERMHQASRQESERKTRLITAASHDLRQPLDVIEVTLENLAPDPAPVSDQLKARVQQLRRLLGTVFDSARLNEGMIEARLQPVSLAAICQDLEDLVTDARAGARLEILTGATNQAVVADPILLFRVLQNLVFNALEHSGGTRVTIDARTTGESADGLLIEVADNGRGLPEDLGDRLFLPYVRGQGRGECPGLGLGLTIVREFIALMGGPLRCGQPARWWCQFLGTAAPGHSHPRSRARFTHSVRLCTPSWVKIAFRWVFTVCSVRFRLWQIRLFGKPRASSSSTSICRGVNGSSEAAGARPPGK